MWQDEQRIHRFSLRSSLISAFLWRCSDERRGSGKNHVGQNEFSESLCKSEYAFQMQEIEYFTFKLYFSTQTKREMFNHISDFI